MRIKTAGATKCWLAVALVATLALAGCASTDDENATPEDCALASTFRSNSNPSEGFVPGLIAASYWPLVTDDDLKDIIKSISDEDDGEQERDRWNKAVLSIEAWQSINCGSPIP